MQWQLYPAQVFATMILTQAIRSNRGGGVTSKIVMHAYLDSVKTKKRPNVEHAQ